MDATKPNEVKPNPNARTVKNMFTKKLGALLISILILLTALTTSAAQTAAANTNVTKHQIVKKQKQCQKYKKVNKTKKYKKCKKTLKKLKAAKNHTTGTTTANNPTTPVERRKGKPAEDNTGVIPGSVLKTRTGDWYVDTPNTRIENYNIVGKLVIRAANVTVKNSYVHGPKTYATAGTGAINATHPNSDGFLIEDVTIKPQTPSHKQNGIHANTTGTINRVNISATVDGIMLYGKPVNITNSYLHDFKTYPNGHTDGGITHNDAIQIEAGTRHNITGNTLTGAINAAIMVTQNAGTTNNLNISNNWLSGGTCTINFSSRGTEQVGMEIHNNKFGPTNCAIIRKENHTTVNATNNTIETTGAPVTITRGG